MGAFSLPLLTALATSCGSSPTPAPARGAIEITVTTDLAVPKDLDVLNVQALNASYRLLNEVRVMGPKGESFPKTFRLESPIADSIRILAMGLSAEGQVPSPSPAAPTEPFRLGFSGISKEGLVVEVRTADPSTVTERFEVPAGTTKLTTKTAYPKGAPISVRIVSFPPKQYCRRVSVPLGPTDPMTDVDAIVQCSRQVKQVAVGYDFSCA